MQETIFSSAARTASANSEDFELGSDFSGLALVLDITAVSGTTPTLDLKLQGKGPGGTYFDIPSAAFAQKTAAGADMLVVYPGVTATANKSVANTLPKTLRVVATIAGTTPSFTFSLVAVKRK